MRDRLSIAFGTLVAVVVLATVAVYLWSADIDLGDLSTVAVIMVLVAFAAYTIRDKTRNRAKGLPASDERLTNVGYRAGYYAFIAALWSAVFAPVIFDTVLGREPEGHEVTAAVVSIAGFVFAIAYLYLARKGK